MNIFSCCFGTSQPESPPHTRPNSPETSAVRSSSKKEITFGEMIGTAELRRTKNISRFASEVLKNENKK